MTPTARRRDEAVNRRVSGQSRETETGLLLAVCGKNRNHDDPARVPAVAATTL